MSEELDIAISSRIRLARNIFGFDFPARQTAEQAEEVIQKVNQAVNPGGELILTRMRDLGKFDRQTLVEKHIASQDLAQCEQAALLTNKDETIAIMVNEEDHIRIQCILPGLQLEKADELTGAIDQVLSKKLVYVFDESLGFLTSCPTNVGTGMRASVMLHLPALTLSGHLGTILRSVSKLGYAVRGYYGEGSAAPGNIYQISNQVTLGLSEEEIIKNLELTVRQIIAREREVREQLNKNNPLELEDRIFRSYGILTNARKLDFNEFMDRISDVKLGVSLGMLDISHEKLHLLMKTQPFIEKEDGKASKLERDKARARLARQILNKS